MNYFQQKIQDRASGIILYGLTPPKSRNTYSKNIEISQRRIERISKVNIDGVVLYDIQDEISRTAEERPFPFLPTLEPTEYFERYFRIDLPVIFYQSTGNYSLLELQNRVNKHQNNAFVFVGSPSKSHEGKTSLSDAYSSIKMGNSLLGGVTIPERHSIKSNENEKVLKKIENGCSFFISQCVYNAGLFKDLISDLYYSCKKNNIPVPTILMTVSPCGSLKTVELFNWLGVKIPRWIENELLNSVDTLEKSVRHAAEIVKDVLDFALEKDIPFGCNVESVSIKKDEVLASFELVNWIEKIFIEAGIRQFDWHITSN